MPDIRDEDGWYAGHIDDDGTIRDKDGWIAGSIN